MPVGNARLKTCRFSAARAFYSCALALLIFLFGSKALQNAVAEGETRAISMHHIHTDEDITITYKRDGRYDEAALEKLNWFLRDWRRGEQTRMDAHLIDLLWEVHRETGAKEPIWVVCGYRAPETNAMLRRRSRGVARFSQHMLGHAMDFYIPGVPLEELRVIGLRLQRGGVGFYPTSGSPFVHMDTGGIRMWPRMTREQLVRVFPNGRTVYIPSDGRPLPGYALALADIRTRGSDPSEKSIEAARNAGMNVSAAIASNERPRAAKNPFAKLLGLAKDEEDEDADTNAAASAPSASPAPTAAAAAAAAAAPAAPAAPAARMQPKSALLAALERKAEQKAESARAAADAQSKHGPAEVAAATTKPKLIHTAALAAPAAPEATQPSAPRRPNESATSGAAPTPNQVIIARGYWGGVPDGVTAAQPAAQAANPLSAPAPSRRAELASADADATGAIGPWSGAHEDRVPPKLALAYAEQPEQQTPTAASPAAPMGGSPARAAADQGRLPPPPDGTTIAVKRAANQAASTIVTAPAKSSSAVAPGAHFDNPWLRAMVMAPSVRRFLSAVALGAQDFRSLAPLMLKPASSVMMTFAADPNLGLAHDHFSGSAIVFVSTVTYPTHTASLR
ncbi:MAG: DUF882 domain-containing protein [Xanthobacteraceae bacterium]